MTLDDVQQPTIDAAHELGAEGAEPTEAERLLFEAWMRGHCWAIVGDWDGKTYVHADEVSGWPHAGAMNTRQLWAAWRDRAALGAAPAAQPMSDEQLADFVGDEYHNMTDSELRWFRLGEAAHGIGAAPAAQQVKENAASLTSGD